MYFDELKVGYKFETGARSLSLDDILTFAGQWDPQPFHTDPVAAEQSTYGGIIASGFQTILIAFGLILESDIWREASMGSPGMQDVRWLKPVRPGDSLRVRGEVLASHPSRSRPDRGRTDIAYEILNQHDEVVAAFQATQILKRKR